MHPSIKNQMAPRQRAAKREADRRIARRAATAAMWWASLPAPRPGFFFPASLTTSIGISMAKLAPSLRMLGWRRITATVDHTQRILWLPPGSPIQPRPRGRPRIYPCL